MGENVTELTGKRLALHVCCGPCFIEPFEALVAQADEVVAVYFNPNIHPADEYRRRRDTLMAYAQELGVRAVELTYDPHAWMRAAGRHGQDSRKRCTECYRLRLGKVARWAADNGFDALTTTLTVSPYQDAEAIARAGEEAAGSAGIAFLRRDFTDRYSEATRRSRELGMYRQNYCGCAFSERAAAGQREQRRAERARARAAREEQL